MSLHTHSTNQTINNFKETAVNIGNYLAREACWDGDRCNWIGHGVEAVGGTFQMARRSFSRDFYNGTSGIAYFLALLLRKEPDPVHEATLEGAVNQILSMSAETDRLGTNYGHYGGRAGVAFALVEIGKMRANDRWIAAGFELMDYVCEQEIEENEIDVIAGVAGAIPLLLRYYRSEQKQHYLETAIRCGDFLLAKADRTANSWSWTTPASAYALTGYSHGNAGIAVALLELYEATQAPRFYSSSILAFNYERMLFNPSVQNWPDLREFNPEKNQAPAYGVAWCHGAPGIALSRLRAWEITGEEQFRQEAEVALATTYQTVYNNLTQPALPKNYSLCHGIAGNADVLLEGARRLGQQQYYQVAAQVGEFGVEQYDKTGLQWPSGVNDPSGLTKGMGDTPGIMLGAAGTGYFYLRLAALSDTESILVA